MIWCDMIPPEPLVPRGLVSLPFSTRNVLGAQKIGWSKHVLNCGLRFEFLNWKSCFQPFALHFCISALPSSVTTTTNNWSFWCDYLLRLWFPLALSPLSPSKSAWCGMTSFGSGGAAGFWPGLLQQAHQAAQRRPSYCFFHWIPKKYEKPWNMGKFFKDQ